MYDLATYIALIITLLRLWIATGILHHILNAIHYPLKITTHISLESKFRQKNFKVPFLTSYSPLVISLANFLDPATLHLSPMFTNSVCLPTIIGSNPTREKGMSNQSC